MRDKLVCSEWLLENNFSKKKDFLNNCRIFLIYKNNILEKKVVNYALPDIDKKEIFNFSDGLTVDIAYAFRV